MFSLLHILHLRIRLERSRDDQTATSTEDLNLIVIRNSRNHPFFILAEIEIVDLIKEASVLEDPVMNSEQIIYNKATL